MTSRPLLPSLLLLASPIVMSAQAPKTATPARVLVFFSEHTEADHVDFAQQANLFFGKEASEHQFSWRPTTDWNDLDDAHLQGTSLVVWLDDEPRTSAQRNAFERYMERGGAWLGFHVSAYNDRDTNWPWFVHFLGGAVFFGNNWPPLPADLVVDDPTTPVTRGLPHSFRAPANEWYTWNPSPRENKDVRVLVSLKPTNYPLGLKDVITGGDLPVVWTNTRYHMLYLNMGHGDSIFSDPVQNQLLRQTVLSLLPNPH